MDSPPTDLNSVILQRAYYAKKDKILTKNRSWRKSHVPKPKLRRQHGP